MEYMTVAEIAEKSGRTVRAVQMAVKSGALVAENVVRAKNKIKYMVSKENAEAWIAKSSAEKRGAKTNSTILRESID